MSLLRDRFVWSSAPENGTDTFVPTDKRDGRPRGFFQDRTFVREFFARTGAESGDTVLFEEITPYHFRLSLRKIDGRLIAG